MQSPFNNEQPLNSPPPIPSPDSVPVGSAGTMSSVTNGRMRLDVPGFENRLVEAQVPSLWKGMKLFLDGQEVKRRGIIPTYPLLRADGVEVPAKFTGGFLAPKVVIEGRTYQLLKTLQWYEWIWACWPVIFVIGGGAIPVLIGLGAAGINASIMRSEKSTPLKYVITGVVNAIAFILFVLLIVAVIVAQNRR